MQDTKERHAKKINAFTMLLVVLALFGLGIFILIFDAGKEPTITSAGALLLMVGAVLMLPGFVVVPPNTAKVLVFFGRYIGSITESGFWWCNPLAKRRTVSLRVNNFNSEQLKVNDQRGNPIQIAAVLVWKVTDPAKALLDVESYDRFIEIQSETVVRALASRFPYDPDEDAPGKSLLTDGAEIAEQLRDELQERASVAGVHIMDARITHLAYAAEIAQAMLKRQQAEALVSARFAIVQGAVSMVELALNKLKAEDIVDLDEERKAQMVNNLMVALVSDSEASPVINAGTLY